MLLPQDACAAGSPPSGTGAFAAMTQAGADAVIVLEDVTPASNPERVLLERAGPSCRDTPHPRILYSLSHGAIPA